MKKIKLIASTSVSLLLVFVITLLLTCNVFAENLQTVQASSGFSSKIPTDAFIYNGHSYYYYDSSTSWESAETYCESLGGHLATITSAEENSAVYKWLTGLGHSDAYIGLTDKKNEGVFEWVTGEPVSYTNWASSEPNNYGGAENYALFFYAYKDGTWNDGDFGHVTVGGRSYICEWDCCYGTDGNIIGTDGNINWSIDSDGTLTISGTGAMPNYSYSSNEPPWHSYRSQIKKVVLSDGITTVGSYTFAQCSNLASVSIPDSVTSIGGAAFYGCTSLASVDIGDSVTSIGSFAFSDCTSLTSVNIPNSVTSIGDCAFFCCSKLTDVHIGDSVASIDSQSFAYCISLTRFTVDANNKYFSSDARGALFNKNKTILIQYPSGNTNTSYSIPNSVTSIGRGSFEESNSLTSIYIPDSVTSIGSSAFAHCTRLASVNIPDSVTSIGDMAFTECTSLASVTIPNSITSIRDYTFHGCTGLTSVSIPTSVTSIGDGVFVYCTCLSTITIPSSVTSIGVGVFEYCTNLACFLQVQNVGNCRKNVGYCKRHFVGYCRACSKAA